MQYCHSLEKTDAEISDWFKHVFEHFGRISLIRLDGAYSGKIDKVWAYVCKIHRLQDAIRLKLTRCPCSIMSEKLHRFAGITESGDIFFVQIKEMRNGQKHFISVFPE